MSPPEKDRRRPARNGTAPKTQPNLSNDSTVRNAEAQAESVRDLERRVDGLIHDAIQALDQVGVKAAKRIDRVGAILDELHIEWDRLRGALRGVVDPHEDDRCLICLAPIAPSAEPGRTVRIADLVEALMCGACCERVLARRSAGFAEGA